MISNCFYYAFSSELLPWCLPPYPLWRIMDYDTTMLLTWTSVTCFLETLAWMCLGLWFWTMYFSFSVYSYISMFLVSFTYYFILRQLVLSFYTVAAHHLFSDVIALCIYAPFLNVLVANCLSVLFALDPFPVWFPCQWRISIWFWFMSYSLSL